MPTLEKSRTTTMQTPNQMAEDAVQLAATLLTEAQEQQTSAEKRQAAKIAGMMDDPLGKVMTMALSDQAFRSHKPGRINNQILHLIEGYGVPAYFADWEQVALDLGSRIGQYIPHMVVPFVVAKLRAETSNVILPGEEEALSSYLKERRSQGTRLNLNHLGEAILGEDEAKRRLDAYLELIARPDVEYISVKISSIFSQINLIAFDHTVREINERLRILYREAMQHNYTRADGTTVPKFINLDMEEYRDLHLTMASFKSVLDEPEFLHYKAGIVLQAYLPDSHMAQQDLTKWAQQRTDRGGAPIKIRIVKGANLAMEQVDAFSHGWAQAPYTTKADVDANYKRMVLWGCQPERARSVNLGIASHNLFDVAFGMTVRSANAVEDPAVEDHVEFEMLEGMANHQARVVQKKAGGLLLYAPVVKQDDFHSAIAYLVRRLDENTAEENFLHDLFSLEVGNETWERQRRFFMAAVARRDSASIGPNRAQNRSAELPFFDPNAPFANEPDTDFSLQANQRWAADIAATWESAPIDDIPLQIDGEFVAPNRDGLGRDPSHPEITARYHYAQAAPPDIEAALVAAVNAQSEWQNHSIQQRRELVVKVAETLAARRGDLIGAAMLDGGKTIAQADVEVSEAIDFANYYARSFDAGFDRLSQRMEPEAELVEAEVSQFTPFGTILITPPWNFPIAIPSGGMLASLMAGNTVILKPAPETVLVAWHLVNAMWDAGIPKTVLQFVPATDDEVGQSLVTDDRIDAVILTGGYETARLFLSWKPEMRLFAETSGKNSMIITGLADHDQAIKDLVYSAFGHNGQKCSAASVAVLEAEVYDNPVFRRQLRDAAASLPVGSAWDLASQVTPLIRPSAGALERTQTMLEPGEEWLLRPEMVDGNPSLWRPGIKLGVEPGSFYHKNECFGPVLGLMRAKDLAHAIEIVNMSEFGLTSGLQSLDDREISQWRESIEVGNAYINRTTTGAIVERQPFGGWKRSAFGTGAKAGGPNYVGSLGVWADRTEGSRNQRETDALLDKSMASYHTAWSDHFSKEHDFSQVLGESNHFRYRPVASMLIRGTMEAAPLEILQAEAAAQVCGVPFEISLPPESALPKGLNEDEVTRESESALASRLHLFERVRHLGTPSTALLTRAHEHHVAIINELVTANGRLELRYYLREQSMTETLHRYGNIMPKPG